MSVDPFVSALLSQGGLGIAFAVVLVLFVRRDRELRAETQARIADAKAYTELALSLQSRVLDAIDKQTTVYEELRRRRGP